ncbi:MAG TPA: tetratricopeptide repeat protein [Terriglobales bacterium]|nr:tetratricopeptide repeat protein [Terriglobales bacterium]
MKSFWLTLAMVLGLAGVVSAQTQVPGPTVLVVPFENRSTATGLEWIGESFPELLEERLSSPTMYVLDREDRQRAYDRTGVPSRVHLSRATIYRIAEEMDVDYVVLGAFGFDGRTFSATARLLDMHRQHLLPEVTETGPLPDLINIETALAWDLVHALRPDLSNSKSQYVAAAAPIRLDAFENYIHGLTDPTAAEQIGHFREAVRLNPAYSRALLQLGKTYYRERQYEQAVATLGRVPANDAAAREANFFLGLSAYSAGQLDRAETAFAFVASRLPLTEVYNNLGVVQDRRGKKSALEYFQKAVEADSAEPDYHFNLAVALYKAGDTSGASRQLKEVLALRPTDGDAKNFYDSISSEASARLTQAPVPSRVPSERIRKNYDERTFRLLALKIEATAEQRMAKADPRTHARYHVDRGNELLTRGFVAEAEKEFREAQSLDNANPAAHSGLARVYEAGENLILARSEAETALRLRPSADAFLVLARLELRDNRMEAAVQDVDQALRLEPANATAQSLKRALAAKLAEKAQPLQNR